MDGPAVQPARILEQLLALPAEQHAALLKAAALRAAEDIDSILEKLAEEIEGQAIAQVSRALDASAVLVDAARSCTSAALATVLCARAQALSYAGRFEEALPAAQEAIELAERSQRALDLGRARLASVHPLLHMARFDEALAAAEAARAASESAGAGVLAGRAMIGIGGVHFRRGDAPAALGWFDRARPHLVSVPVLLAQLEVNRGLALLSLDDFVGAEECYRAALPIFESARLAWATSIVEGNLAELAARQGRLQSALHYFERARRHLDEDTAPAELARILVEQGDALLSLGAAAPALEQYRAALPELERNGMAREAVQARAGIGRALAAIGQGGTTAGQTTAPASGPAGTVAEAETLLRAAAAEYERLGLLPDAARLELLRSQLALDAGRTAEARQLAEQVLGWVSDHPADAAAARYHVARAALADGEAETALAALAPAIATARQLANAPLLADLLHLRSLVHRRLGQTTAATADLRNAVEQIERVRGTLQAERLRVSFQTNRLGLYDALILAALDSGTAEGLAEAFQTIERAKARTLLDQVQHALDEAGAESAERGGAAVSDAGAPAGSVAPDPRAAELAALRRELNFLYGRLADARFGRTDEGRVADWQDRIRVVEERFQQLELRLSAAGGVASLFAPPADLSAVQRWLAADAALIQYYFAEDELLAIVVRRDGAQAVRSLGRSDAVAEPVDRLHFQLRRALRPDARDPRRSARMHADALRELGGLYDVLLRPLGDQVAGAGRLVFVPHGALHAVPMAALWDGTQHVAATYECVMAPNASVLLQASMAGAAAAGGPVLVVGVADEYAPQIEAEARQVAAALGAERVLLGAEATVQRVQVEMSEACIIHLACHGHFDPQHPQASGLRLADGWLTTGHIYEMRLRARLVTLSGCETGRHVVGQGDDLLGLMRAFLAAGARALLVSLWTVGDASTAEFMAAFYGQLAPGGAGSLVTPGQPGPLLTPRQSGSLAAAVRVAQLAVQQNYPHPVQWAPFVLVGV